MKWWQAGLIVTLSVSIACLFTTFLSSDFSSIDIFAPIEKKVDFKVSDIYNMVEENRPERDLSQEVVVINADNFNREGVLDIIHTVSDYGAKAIGLDIYFSIRKADNEYLFETIRKTENMVSITKVIKEPEREYYTIEDQSFYDQELTPPHKGYANLDINHPWNVVRTFLPFVCTREGDTIPSMALELARIANPARAQQLLNRHNTEEIIDFTHQEIEIIPAERLDNADVAKRIKDKVVMIGLVNDNKDIYLTPLHEPTAGVMVHAYAVQTILSGTYIQTRERWKDWTIAICACLLLVCLLLFANEYDPLKYALNFVVRILLFVGMYLFVYCGCQTFANAHIYADYTPAILMLVFGALAFDIVYAAAGLVEQNYEKYQQSKSHKQ